MLSPENPLSIGFSPETSHQTALLIELLNRTDSTLQFTQEKQWELLAKAHAPAQHFATSETMVVVGQAINISSLNAMIKQYFPSVNVFTFSLHPLHKEFAQQAVIVNLHHSGTDSLLSTSYLSEISTAFFVDCFAVSQVDLKQAGLLVMDMDSTIINMECIDEIAALAGVGEKVSELTERAMRGELDFNQSLFARVDCLKGIEVDALASLKARLPVNPGFAKTMRILQANGWQTVIASGGFTYFANYLKDTFELSEAFSNTLGINGSTLNGTVEGDIVNGEMKRSILLEQQRIHAIKEQQTVAIGDGANDLLMMEAAQLGVAYKAKPKVKAQADASIQYCGFEGLLYCLKQ